MTWLKSYDLWSSPRSQRSRSKSVALALMCCLYSCQRNAWATDVCIIQSKWSQYQRPGSLTQLSQSQGREVKCSSYLRWSHRKWMSRCNCFILLFLSHSSYSTKLIMINYCSTVIEFKSLCFHLLTLHSRVCDLWPWPVDLLSCALWHRIQGLYNTILHLRLGSYNVSHIVAIRIFF